MIAIAVLTGMIGAFALGIGVGYNFARCDSLPQGGIDRGNETLDDIIDQLADWVGVYGAHDNDEPRRRFPPEMHCRVCFTGAMRARIEAAANVEAIMRRVNVVPPRDSI